MEMQKLALEILQQACGKFVSDVGILPVSEGYQITLRNALGKEIIREISEEHAEKLLLFFKFKGGMDVAERRKPQLGAMTFALEEQTIRLRLSTVADFQQRESLVIRLLYGIDEAAPLSFHLPQQWQKLAEKSQKRGLYLFCGPVNSGKTTTMYHLAKNFSNQNQQVITVEDPVEIVEADFLQIQTNPKITVNYNELVKLSLRHHPDILIVGEIRDEETAAAVIRGALTGHTIFSTLHVSGKEQVIPRLLELGVSEAQVLSVLQGIFFQRLLPYKNQHKQGVLFDLWFADEGQAIKNQWPEILREVWCRGNITDETLAREK